MPSVSVLYISDDVVGPHLELLRNICEPDSRSKPHVTVRYFNKLSVPSDHLQKTVGHIDILEPDSFGFDVGDSQENRTIYLRCRSDDLLSLEHKPYFPTSELHITVYDGSDESFAKSLLKLLEGFRWGFRLLLPVGSSLSEIKLRNKAKKKEADSIARVYAAPVQRLFAMLTGDEISNSRIKSFSAQERLALAFKICTHLSESTRAFQQVQTSPRRPHGQFGPEPSRDSHAIHLTPPELAESIVRFSMQFVKDRRHVDFGDPAVGTGAFFAALLQVLPRKSIRSAIGIDVSRRQVQAARWKWANKDMEVIEGDYLHLEKLPLRNLILANPPYMRHQGIPARYKEELRQRASTTLGMRVSGLSGQYVYFLLLSHAWMQPDAVAAWLIPSEFMRASYGESIRAYLTQKVNLIRVHQFDPGDRQFENAEVLPSVVVFKNSVPVGGETAVFSTGGSLQAPTFSEEVAVAAIASDLKWMIPRKSPRDNLNRIATIGDFFDVKRGIATGANSFFIIERNEAKRLNIPEVFLRPIVPKIRNLTENVIYAEADGYPSVNEQLCLIDCSLPEAVVREKFPCLMRYYEDGVAAGLLNRYMLSRRSPWYKQEQRSPAPFLCTYMGKSTSGRPAIRFVWNQSKAVATNTYLMLYPKRKLAELIAKDNSLLEQIFEALNYAATNTAADFYRFHAGGLSKIEPRELEQVVLPQVSKIMLDTADIRLL